MNQELQTKIIKGTIPNQYNYPVYEYQAESSKK